MARTNVTATGGVFAFEQIAISSHDTFKYSFSSVELIGIYAKIGGGFYLTTANVVTALGHPTEITLEEVTIKDSFSYTSGMFHAKSGSFTVKINDSKFQSNTGVSGEADFRVETVGGLEVTSTTFTLFKSSTGLQRVSIMFTVPQLNSIASFTSVTVKWSDEELDDEKYKLYVQSGSVFLDSKSPIVLNPGKVKFVTSTFSNWASAKLGGAISILGGSVSQIFLSLYSFGFSINLIL